ncbi:SDR family oxidoreductase [Streptomyces sp. NPDC098781]|uniref:SDR family oxidoreductase n=1 Tax=Streptomyces sp. NPDC098781 TaxID=3366097 RepID=UPI00380992EA
MHHGVLVAIGAGGMGQAVARRMGTGRPVLIADEDGECLLAAGTRLERAGYQVSAQKVDVSSPASVTALARRAAGLGPVTHVVHTAGLSPAQADVSAILAVDLVGVALVVEEFGQVVAPGGAGVVVAGGAGHYCDRPLTAEERRQLRRNPARELPSLPVLRERNFAGPGQAYGFAQHANRLRVREAARSWGERGARINSISPGVIATPRGQAELAGPHGAAMRTVLGTSPVPRLGTPEDIAAAAEFLLGATAGFITGADLLVDGGCTALLDDLPPARQ